MAIRRPIRRKMGLWRGRNRDRLDVLAAQIAGAPFAAIGALLVGGWRAGKAVRKTTGKMVDRLGAAMITGARAGVIGSKRTMRFIRQHQTIQNAPMPPRPAVGDLSSFELSPRISGNRQALSAFTGAPRHGQGVSSGGSAP